MSALDAKFAALEAMIGRIEKGRAEALRPKLSGLRSAAVAGDDANETDLDRVLRKLTKEMN